MYKTKITEKEVEARILGKNDYASFGKLENSVEKKELMSKQDTICTLSLGFGDGISFLWLEFCTTILKREKKR